MHDLEYSGDALNTLNEFYRCDRIVYVEGDDDELFWTAIFNACAQVKIVTEALGGATELDKRIKRIIEEDLEVLAARDGDYVVLCGKHVDDPRVVYTYGYSIENTLYTSSAVAQIARLWTKGKAASIIKATTEWLTSLSESSEELTSYDVANFLHDCGLAVAGDNIARFSTKRAPHEIDKSELEKHLQKISKVITDEMLIPVNEHLERIDRDAANWLKGHFLASAVLQFIGMQIKASGLGGKISHEALYAGAIQYLEGSFKEGHPHYEYYERVTRTALEEVE